MSADDDNIPDSSAPKQERRKGGDHEAYFNAQFDAKPLSIGPGQTLCGHDEEVMYVAHVGSGVLVTMHDTELKIGAMGYVLAPSALIESFPHFEQADAKWRAWPARSLPTWAPWATAESLIWRAMAPPKICSEGRRL